MVEVRVGKLAGDVIRALLFVPLKYRAELMSFLSYLIRSWPSNDATQRLYLRF